MRGTLFMMVSWCPGRSLRWVCDGDWCDAYLTWWWTGLCKNWGWRYDWHTIDCRRTRIRCNLQDAKAHHARGDCNPAWAHVQWLEPWEANPTCSAICIVWVLFLDSIVCVFSQCSRRVALALWISESDELCVVCAREWAVRCEEDWKRCQCFEGAWYSAKMDRVLVWHLARTRTTGLLQVERIQVKPVFWCLYAYRWCQLFQGRDFSEYSTGMIVVCSVLFDRLTLKFAGLFGTTGVNSIVRWSIEEGTSPWSYQVYWWEETVQGNYFILGCLSPFWQFHWRLRKRPSVCGVFHQSCRPGLYHNFGVATSRQIVSHYGNVSVLITHFAKRHAKR